MSGRGYDRRINNNGLNQSSGRNSRGRGRGRGRVRGRGRGRDSNGSSKRSNQSDRSSKDVSASTRFSSSEMNQRSRREVFMSQSRSDRSQVVKRNGEKGAESHTVSENERIRFTKMLIDMRENDDLDRVEMPCDLTNTERKFIHELAIQLGLKSKSYGKGEERHIVITKIGNGKKIDGKSDVKDKELPFLKIGRKGISALQYHIQKYPPSDIELKESILTGSSIMQAFSSQQHCNSDDLSDNNVDQNITDETIVEAVDHVPNASSKNSQRNKKPLYSGLCIDHQKRISQYYSAQKAKTKNKRFQKVLNNRKNLPAFQFQREICDAVQNNRVTLISGDTGCGKSTQIPQFLLDDEDIGPNASIVVTQPRRISAISIADRVASERCEEVGGVVGYQVRLENSISQRTQLLFLTPGVLLKKFQSSSDLQEFTHVIIDEIHERDKYTEFLLIALKDLMSRRHNLRIVLMSATIQTNELLEYWSGLENPKITEEVTDSFIPQSYRPVEVNIPGRTFPVQEFFLEDVLKMTGFVDDGSSRYGTGSGQLDLDLLNSLVQKTESKRRTSRKNKMKPTASNSYYLTEALTCVMCGKTGFRCPEELGTHVALCNGGGGISMGELEDKVRDIEYSTIAGYNRQPNSSNTVQDEENDVNYEIYNEDSDGDDEDDRFELDNDPILSMGKWDGESPFVVTDILTSSKKATLTEEETLNRYQETHDDEQIDDELILEVVKYICKSSYGDGAILIFFPGWQEISEFGMVLETTSPFNDDSKYSVLTLHSGIPSKDQRKIFLSPPDGVRKIVLATNIAETSITIDDVAFVIDTGRAKEKNYDPHLKISTLQPVWVSQASAKQRKGRAGRTKPGVCFHLFSRRRHESLRPFLESELLRTPLEEMCLQCKKLELAPGGQDDPDGIPSFLGKALTPPHPKSVQNALDLLVEIGAMDEEMNALTDLGLCLSVLSLEPRVGKMVIWSYILGCSRSATSMGVAMSYKSPFVLPPNSMRQKADQAKVAISEGSESDQITILNVLKARDLCRKNNKGFNQYCRRNFLNYNTVQMVSDLRRNIGNELEYLGFPAPSSNNPKWHNRNGFGNSAFLQATIAAGLYPNVASRTKGDVNFSTISNRKAKVHISSVNSCDGQPLSSKCQVGKKEIEFIVFGEMVRGVASFTMNQTTHLASGIPLILMCGNLNVRPAEVEGEERSVLSVDGWINFICQKDIASALVILRRRLDVAFAKVVANPSAGLSQLNSEESDAVEVLCKVVNHATSPR